MWGISRPWTIWATWKRSSRAFVKDPAQWVVMMKRQVDSPLVDMVERASDDAVTTYSDPGSLFGAWASHPSSHLCRRTGHSSAEKGPSEKARAKNTKEK